jgi:iron complex transport system substrate-binding protein
MMYWINRLQRHLSGGRRGVALRFAQVKEEPAKRAGDTEQNAVTLRVLLALVTLNLGLLGSAQATQVTDDRGITVTLPSTPNRIVSLLPSLAETVCELGHCARLVGVDRYSNFPASLQKLPQVGGGLDPNIEAIVALKPDVVLMAKSSRAGERLEALGLKVVALEPKTHADVQRVMLKLGQLLDVPDAARIWRAIDAGVSAAAQSMPANALGTRVYFEVNQGPYAAGESSFIGETLTRLGAKNIVPAKLGPFPKLNPEFIVRANPDLIMIGQRSADGLITRPGWHSIRALREQRVCVFPADAADALVRPGPRMAEGARLMAQCLSSKAPGAKP